MMGAVPNILGVIPARGGSKGIPDKNIITLGGHPLIHYTILSAMQSKNLTQFLVSTDSQKIAEVAQQLGAPVPFIRPGALGGDRILAVDVVKHAVLEMERITGVIFDFVTLLQPTTPLKLSRDIDDTLTTLIQTGCDTVLTVVDVGANHPARMCTISRGDRLVPVMDEGVPMRPRQELPPVYIRNGAVYACKRDVLWTANALIGKDVRVVVMPRERSVNIDCPEDLAVAESCLRNRSLTERH